MEAGEGVPPPRHRGVCGGAEEGGRLEGDSWGVLADGTGLAPLALHKDASGRLDLGAARFVEHGLKVWAGGWEGKGR